MSRAYAESQGDNTGTNKEAPSVLGQSHQEIPRKIGCDRFIHVLGMWLSMSLSSGIHGLGLPLGKVLGTASPAICGPKEASQIVSSPLLSQGHHDQPWGVTQANQGGQDLLLRPTHTTYWREGFWACRTPRIRFHKPCPREGAGSSQPPLRLPEKSLTLENGQLIQEFWECPNIVQALVRAAQNPG